ncbi:MAG: SET domain-containing protein-lysine N-methyltransferase [Patescibacteria group bacterium]
MKRNKYLQHTWVDPRIIAKFSPIHGKGLFASNKIKRGEVIMIWGGEVIKKSGYNENMYRELTVVPISEDSYLGLPVSDQSESLDEYLNHSCDPTAWLTDEVTVAARRDIVKGTEITVDFATWEDDQQYSYADGNICLCKSKYCRKILSNRSWMDPELQIRYKSHFTPFLEKRIQKLKNKKG